MRTAIRSLSRGLRELHKRFIELERRRTEEKVGRRLSSFDFLQVLTQDQNFAWLRPLSALIAEIDAFGDEAETVGPSDLEGIHARIDAVLDDGESKLVRRLREDLAADPELVLAFANLSSVRRATRAARKETSHDQRNP